MPAIAKRYVLVPLLLVILALAAQAAAPHIQLCRAQGGPWDGVAIHRVVCTPARYPLVEVYASVIQDGKPALGIRGSDLSLWENGVQHEMDGRLARQTAAHEIAIVVDAPQLLTTRPETLKGPLLAFVRELLRPEDGVAIYGACREGSRIQYWTHDRDALASAIDHLECSDALALSQLVSDVISDLEGRGQTRPSPAVLVVLTELDFCSWVSSADGKSVVDHLRQLDAMLVGLGLGAETSAVVVCAKDWGDAYCVQAQPSADSLRQALQVLANRVDNQIVLRYESDALPKARAELDVQCAVGSGSSATCVFSVPDASPRFSVSWSSEGYPESDPLIVVELRSAPETIESIECLVDRQRDALLKGPFREALVRMPLQWSERLPGEHQVEVRVTDNADNMGAQTLSVRMDATTVPRRGLLGWLQALPSALPLAFLAVSVGVCLISCTWVWRRTWPSLPGVQPRELPGRPVTPPGQPPTAVVKPSADPFSPPRVTPGREPADSRAQSSGSPHPPGSSADGRASGGC